MRKYLAAMFAASMTIVGLSVASSATADEATTTPLTESQIDTTGTTGTVNFLDDGVYLRTKDWSQEAVGLYDVGVEMQDVTTAPSFDWNGTSNPGMRFEIDLGFTTEPGHPDGDPDGVLTYETVYGGNLWLSPSSGQMMKDLAPHVAPGNGNNNGQGSQWYGTWEEWRANVTSETEIARAGFLLGVPGRGTLLSQTIGDTTYTFAKDAEVEPLPVARPKVKWAQNIKVNNRRVSFRVEARQPKGTQSTKKGAYYRIQVYNPRTERTRFAGSGRVTADNSDHVKVFPSAYLPKAKKPLRVRMISYQVRRANVKFVPTKQSRNHAKADASRKIN